MVREAGGRGSESPLRRLSGIGAAYSGQLGALWEESEKQGYCLASSQSWGGPVRLVVLALCVCCFFFLTKKLVVASVAFPGIQWSTCDTKPGLEKK